MLNKVKNHFYILLSIFLVSSSLEAVQHHEIGEQGPKPGFQICSENECYTIQKELGEGFYGKVFEVTGSSGKTFAMKWYKNHDDEIFKDNKFLKILDDIEREFVLGQTLSHPHILKTIELFSDQCGENHFLILEYVKGSTVRFTPRLSISKEDAQRASLQFLDALQYALDAGYFYLDLHHGNLMLDQDCNIMVIDVAGFFSWSELFEVFFMTAKNCPGQIEKRIDNQFGPKRAKILKQFISEKDEFFNKLLPKKEGANTSGTHDFEYMKRFYGPSYFNRITNVVADMHSKSSMDRDQKVDLRSLVKKMAWELIEIHADGIATEPLESCFQKLGGLLEHSK